MENNFESNLRDSLSNPPDFPFDEKMWEAIEPRIDQPTSNKKQMLAGLLPFILLALIPAGFAGFFYTKYNTALEKNSFFEQQLQNQQTLLIDTVYQKHVTIVYDTIFKKVTIEEMRYSNEKAYNNELPAKHPKGEFANKVGSFLTSPYSVFNSKNSHLRKRLNESNPFSFLLNPSGELREEAVNEPFDLKSLIAFLPMLDSEFLNTSEVDLTLPSVDARKKKQRKTGSYYLMQMKPDRYSISANGGTFMAFSSLKESNWNTSLQGEIGYGKKISLVFGAELLSYGLKLEKDDDMSELPEPPDDVLGGTLKEIYGDFKFFQVPFGLKYSLFPKSRFRPFLGGGLISRKSIKSQLEYEMIATGDEYYLSSPNLLPGSFGIEAYWGAVGLQVGITKKINLMFESGTQIDLDSGTYPYENLRLLKFNAGIKYQL